MKMKEVGDEYYVITEELVCKISKTLHLAIYNKKGVLISEDERGFHWQDHAEYGGNIVYCSKKIQEQECFYGLGDKPNKLNMRGLRFETWGSDMYGFEKTQTRSTRIFHFSRDFITDCLWNIFRQ